MIFICVNAHKDRIAQKLVDIGYSFGALKIIQRQSVGFQFFIFVSNEWNMCVTLKGTELQITALSISKNIFMWRMYQHKVLKTMV